MPRVKIKSLDERVATNGLHMGGGPERRKLQPGEVVEIEEGPLLDILWNTGKLEMTLDPATRPLDYEDYREARLCSPTFKSRGPDEDLDRDRARAAVAERLANQSVTQAPEPESPVADEQPEPVIEDAPVVEPPKPTARNRRAERRAALRAAQSGEAVTT